MGALLVIEKIETADLTSNTIKIIAIIAMTVDHMAWTIFPCFQTNLLALFMH